MNIKTPEARTPLLIALFLLCIIFALSINKQRIKEETFTVIDTVMTLDWGFSGLKGLFGITSFLEFGETPTALAVELVAQLPERVLLRLPNIIYTKITNFQERPNIERLDIDIKFEHYQTILKDRKGALKDDILTQPHEVPAKIRYKGKTHKAKLRLKGDLYNHWRSPTRMSFRVSLKGNKTIKGFKRFSLHKPADRQYPYDQIFQNLVVKSGNIATKHDYVQIFVNGQKWGIMNIEEHMSKELLEKQETKNSIILKLTNEKNWYYHKIKAHPYQDYRLSNLAFSTSVYQSNKYLADPIHRAHYSYVAHKFERGEEDDLLDVDSFSSTALISIIWNSFHSLVSSNARYYFNPYTLKIEPVSADQSVFKAIEKEQYLFSDLHTLEMPSLYKRALFSEKGLTHFRKNLNTAIQAVKQAPEIYDYHSSFFPSNYPIDIAVLASNLDAVKSLKTQTPPMSIKADPVDQKAEKDRPSITPPTPEQAADLLDHIHVRHYDDGRLHVFNLLNVPVQLKEILYDKKPLESVEPVIIPPYTENNGLLVIPTNQIGLHDKKFTLVTSYGGHQRTARNEATLVTAVSNPLAAASITQPAFVKKDKNTTYVPAGQWNVKTPLVIDGSLTLKPGAILSFAPEAYLIVKGALIAKGTAQLPIVLKPSQKHWKGLYVLEAQKPSILSHVTFTNTNALQDGLLTLTGGVTFYKSPVTLEQIQIIGTQAEDALNIVKSDFLIKDSFIANTRSDAFDSDFSTGKIVSTILENIGGDALDFSGGQAHIENVTITDVHDKSISAGEQSNLTVKNSIFKRVGVGIASKDGSVVAASSVTVLDYALHAAMTYVKKDMFGPSAMTISGLTHNGSTPFSRQKKTELSVDGKWIRSKKIDVKELYNNGVMRK